MPQPSPSPHRWNQIRQLPMHPHIQTLAQYELAVTQGAADAYIHARSLNLCTELRPADIQALHFHIFARVHPWAGTFRQVGQLAIIAGRVAAEPGRIVRELQLTWRQGHYLLSHAAGDPLKTLAALSLGHVRLERIHPFRDGNGRTGRIILGAQFERVFGLLPRFDDQRGYRNALSRADTGDLAPMMAYLSTSTAIRVPASPWLSPFRIAPRFLDGIGPEPSLDDDWQWSLRG